MKIWFVTIFVVAFVLSLIGGFFFETVIGEKLLSLKEDDVLCFADEKEEEAKEILFDASLEEEVPLEKSDAKHKYVRNFPLEEGDHEEMMKELGFKKKEEVMSFLTAAPLVSLSEPMSDEELGTLFWLLVEFFNADTMEGTLERIALLKEDDRLLICAEVNLSLNSAREKYHAEFLPKEAPLFASVSFDIKNSELSVDYNKTILRFDGVQIPEALLSRVGVVSKGKKSGKRLFADAVGNVVRNAGFCG